MFKILVKYIGEFKRDAVLTPVLVVMEVIIPIIIAAIIDYGLETGAGIGFICHDSNDQSWIEKEVISKL